MKKLTANKLSQLLNISKSRAQEALIKAQLIAGITKAMEDQGLTHQEVALRSGLPRSAVTGIISGSLQKITIDRLLKLVEAVGQSVEIRLKKAS